jgi:WD40 repeat protein
MQIINSKSMVSGDKEGKLVFLYNCMRSVVMNAGSSIDRLSVVSPSRIIGISCNQDRLYKFDPELNQVWHRTFFNASGQMAGIAALKEYLLAIAFKDGKVALLNDKTGKTQIKLFQACNSEVVDIQKINKRFFATVRKDGTTNIWDSKTPGCKKVFMGAGGAAAVTAVGIQWDKKKKEAIIATGYSDGRMLINRTQLN